MAHYNIHFSPTGGTKKVADILVSTMFEEYTEIDLCREIEALTLDEKDVCVISVPSYGGRVPATAIERLQKISAQGTKAVLNCVYGNREWEDTLTELQDTLERLGFVCVAAVAAVAEHSIFRQFATGRPNAEDAVELVGFAKEIGHKLSRDEHEPLSLPGNHAVYKVYKGSSLKPEGDEKCISCGLCARSCPVSAIDLENPSATDKEKCISCMRCISLCPTHARDFAPDLMKTMGERMAPVLGGYKNNHLFL